MTDQPTAPSAPPAPLLASGLFAVSLLLDAPAVHSAATVLASDASGALAVALREADRTIDAAVRHGAVSPIRIDDVAVALVQWLAASDPAARATLAEDLIARLPPDLVRAALTDLADALDERASHILAAQQQRRGRTRAASAPAGPPAGRVEP